MTDVYEPLSEAISKEAQFEDLRWEYLTLGSGKDTLIAFPGGLRRPVYGGSFMRKLSKEFKILIPTYPRISSLNRLAEGVIHIMDQENIVSAHLFGSSFGGLMAQAFIVFYPSRVKKMIIANTGTVSDENRLSKKINRSLTLIRILPAFIVRKLMIRSFTRLIPSNINNREEIVNLIQKTIKSGQLDKEDIICHFESLLDFQNHLDLTAEVASSFQHNLLIITSENDTGVSPDAYSSLKNLYPKARFHHFLEGGHMPMLAKPHEYVQTVRDFLKS